LFSRLSFPNTKQKLEILMYAKLFLFVGCLFVSLYPATGFAFQIELIGVEQIAGDAKDKSGLTELFPITAVSAEDIANGDSQPAAIQFSNEMLGGLSAIAYTGEDDIYYALPDRGPLDGAVDWKCRFQKFQISIDPSSDRPVSVKLLESVVLKDENGQAFSGQASASAAGETSDVGFSKTPVRFRLDPEGIRVLENKNILISDEYGPRVIEFTPEGNLVRNLSVPKKFLIEKPGLSKADENPKNLSGRAANRGMEGLAFSSTTGTVFGLMQSPLLQDSFRPTMVDYPIGCSCRLWQSDLECKTQKELLYQLDSPSYKLNEILAIDKNHFLTIERDGEAGTLSKFKRLMLISTEGATDVSEIASLPHDQVPEAVVPVAKKTFIDLLDPKWNLAGEQMPEKIEGLAFGPDLADGRKTLLVTSDNDFEPANPSWIYVFAVPADQLR
jgi:hypothetical protein